MKRKLSFLPAVLMLCCCNITAFASVDTGNAVADIMNDERFQGAMSTINGVTGFIDHYMTMAITVVAFVIISAALFKNVCAAAYCSNSKFWNKVAAAHEAADAASLASLFQGVKGLPQKTWGGDKGFKTSLLAFIPNIKALTDFDDVEMEPKHYWMKAIPQMLACVVIGVFVYNGYYRDTASVVGDVGSEVISRALASVDPKQLVDTITLTTGTPDNIFENDPTHIGGINYDVSMELYKVFRSAWGISDTSQKTELMRNCEAHATTLTESFKAQFVTDPSSNKIMKLSGLTVVPISDTASARSSEAISGEWFANNGAQYTGGSDCGVFQQTDNGATRAFALYHAAPNVGTASSLHPESSWYKIMGTLTMVDGDSSNQDTSIKGETFFGSNTLVYNANNGVETQVIAVNNSAIDGDRVNVSYIDNHNAYTYNGEIFADVHQYMQRFVTDKLNEGVSDSGKTVVVNVGVPTRSDGGNVAANKDLITCAL